MNYAELLIRLQEIDLELIRDRRDLERVQQKEKLDQFRRAEAKLAKNANKIKGVRKDLELEHGDNRFEKEHLSDIVVSVRDKFDDPQNDYVTIKQLQSQLTHLAKRIEKLDFECKTIEENLAKARLAEDNAAKLANRLDEEKQVVLKTVEDNSAVVQKHIDELDAERNNLLAQLPTDLADEYNQCLSDFGGLAVEQLAGNKPSICRVSLQASQYADIKDQNSQIVRCPYCKRILILDDIAMGRE